jgi:D-beta-D-heptose 7-phosphate kinase/D-beta-D-heptose 1-phosphate adenosyltransferase
MTGPAVLQQLIANFSQRRIGILGDVMVDRFIYGDVQRISPEAPVPVVAVLRRTAQAGGAGNVACNVVSLGGSASLFGYAGSDEAGAELRSMLSQYGIDQAGLQAPAGGRTTVKTRVVARSQHLIRIDEESPEVADDGAADLVLAELERQLPNINVLAISDYSKGVLNATVARKALALCQAAGVPVVVDPKPANIGNYAGALLVKPNMGEARLVAGAGATTPEQICRRVAELAGVDSVVVTAGADGIYVLANGTFTHLPGHPRDVYDVAGAGDSALAAIALGIAAGADVVTAAELGNLAGSRAVGHLGVAAISAAELVEELHSHDDAQ